MNAAALTNILPGAAPTAGAGPSASGDGAGFGAMVAAALAETGAPTAESGGQTPAKPQATTAETGECLEQPVNPGEELWLGLLSVAAPVHVPTVAVSERSSSSGSTGSAPAQAPGLARAGVPGLNLTVHGSADANLASLAFTDGRVDGTHSRPAVAPHGVLVSGEGQPGTAQPGSAVPSASNTPKSDAVTATGPGAGGIGWTPAASSAAAASVGGSGSDTEGLSLSVPTPPAAGPVHNAAQPAVTPTDTSGLTPSVERGAGVSPIQPVPAASLASAAAPGPAASEAPSAPATEQPRISQARGDQPPAPSALAALQGSPAVLAISGRSQAPGRAGRLPSAEQAVAAPPSTTPAPALAAATTAGAVSTAPASTTAASPSAGSTPAPPMSADQDGAASLQGAGAPLQAPEAPPAPRAQPRPQSQAQASAETGSRAGGAEPQSTSTAVQSVAKTVGETAPEPTKTAAAAVIAPAVVEAAEAPREPTALEPRAAEAAPSTPGAETRTAQIVRGAPETVASLAAEIQRKLEGRNTRFEVALDPAGLGMVNVSIDIGADGRMSAQLAFERPEAAAELRGRSAELQRALEQAGFDLSRGGLSFNGEGARERSGGDQPRHGHARAQAFQNALLAAESADALPAQALRLRDRAGIDVRI